MRDRQVQQMCKSLNDEDAELPGGERQHDQVFPMVRHGQILIRIRLPEDRSEASR